MVVYSHSLTLIIMSDSKTIKASEFKVKCLKLMDEVADSGEVLVITKNKIPIAKLSPYYAAPKTLVGIDKNKLQVSGDIISPIKADRYAASEQAGSD